MFYSYFRKTLQGFRGVSTIHGVAYFRNRGTLLDRIISGITTIILIGVLSLLSYQTYLTVADYLTFGTKTEVKFQQLIYGQTSIDFPAITFCANNQVFSDFVGTTGNPADYMPFFLIGYETTYFPIPDAATMCSSKDPPPNSIVQNMGTIQAIIAYGQSFLSYMSSHTSLNSVLGCMWQRRSINCADLFLNKLTDSTTCFTFYPSSNLVSSYSLMNMTTAAIVEDLVATNCSSQTILFGCRYPDNADVQPLTYSKCPAACQELTLIEKSWNAFGTTPEQIQKYNLSWSNSGPRSGFEILLHVNSEQYCTAKQQFSYGFSATLHDRDIPPIIYNAPSLELSAGFAINIAIEYVEMHRQTENLGRCSNNFYLEYFPHLPTYSNEACIVQCLAITMVNATCGCLPYYTPPYAIEQDSIICGQSVALLGCYVDLQHGQNLANYNLSQYSEIGLTAACDIQCPIQCDEKKYYAEVSYSPLRSPLSYLTMAGDKGALLTNISLSSFRKDYLYVNFYLKQPQYQIITESQAVFIQDVFNSFGGALGLCIGGSLISIGELFVVLYYIFAGACAEIAGRRFPDPYHRAWW